MTGYPHFQANINAIHSQATKKGITVKLWQMFRLHYVTENASLGVAQNTK